MPGLCVTARHAGECERQHDLPATHPAFALLTEQGIGFPQDELILRRIVGTDGKSRAFVNDEPVSVTFAEKPWRVAGRCPWRLKPMGFSITKRIVSSG